MSLVCTLRIGSLAYQAVCDHVGFSRYSFLDPREEPNLRKQAQIDVIPIFFPETKERR